MLPISQLTKSNLRHIKVLCFDCDGVTIPKGTAVSQVGSRLTIVTRHPSPTFTRKLNQLKNYFHIAFNSGRSHLFLLNSYQDLLWDNISFISENGNFLLHQGSLIQTAPLTVYELNTLARIRRDLQKIQRTDRRIRGFEPKTFLISLHCWQPVPQVESIVKKNDYQNQFYCWWNDEAYDIAPIRINKAFGIQSLSKILGLSPGNFLTVGNGINDTDMNRVDGISVTTNPVDHPGDFFVEGEHLGGHVFVDHLLQILK